MSIQTDILNDHQAATKAMHQARRALKIVDVLMRHGATPQQAEGLSQEARDVVGKLAGLGAAWPSPTTWAIACVLLDAEQARLPENNPACRFAADPAYPVHQCARRDGRPVVEGEECWAEMRAQLLEEMSPAEFVDALSDRTRCSFCDGPAVRSGVTPDGRDDIRACVDPIHQRHLRDPFDIAVGGACADLYSDGSPCIEPRRIGAYCPDHAPDHASTSGVDLESLVRRATAHADFSDPLS